MKKIKLVGGFAMLTHLVPSVRVLEPYEESLAHPNGAEYSIQTSGARDHGSNTHIVYTTAPRSSQPTSKIPVDR